MTLVNYHETGRSVSRPSSLTSFSRTMLSAALKLRNEWHRRQTEKMLEALPSDIRKDIGWPTSVQGPVHRP